MTCPPAPLLRLVALHKRYGAAVAVAGVDLEVAPGEIVGLLGPNGAGKTTVLECLLGLRPADTGEITLDGCDLRTRPSAARRRVGAQIQPAALQDKITPREALTFFASFHREPADTGELLDRFGLAEKADARFDTLSAGQRQRLSVALAFVNRPTLLVLDEPTTGLDPQTRRALHAILVAHRTGGGAVLLSTHDLDEAQRLCDRVAILHRGRLVALGSPDELLAHTRATTRLEFRTAQPLANAALAELQAGQLAPPQPPVNASTGYRLRTTEPTRAIAALTQVVQATGNELLELQLRPPTLEDAFVALTGEGWDGDREAAP